MTKLRREYTDAGLNEQDLDANPFNQFDQWFQEAIDAKIDLPDAMTLATATKDGIPSARIVLLRGHDERGFVFYTDYESQKGKELAENPNAALVFYWRELDRQVRITGQVSKVSRENSYNYFQSRPIGSRLAALASKQSEVIPDRQVLEEQFNQLAEQYQNKEVPLPSDWGGYRLSPNMIEFWSGRPSRLHDRFRYTRQSDDDWRIERISP